MRRRACEQAGVVLPMVIWILLIVTLFASVAAVAAIGSSHQSQYSRDRTAALSAAEAGVDTALFRLNHLLPGDAECAAWGGVNYLHKVAVEADQWCTAETGAQEGDARYAYRVSSAHTVPTTCQVLQVREIVAYGYVVRAGQVRAKRGLSAQISVPGAAGGECAVQGAEAVRVTDNAKILGNAASNAKINISESGSVCGDAILGNLPTPGVFTDTVVGGGVCGAKTWTSPNPVNISNAEPPKLENTANGLLASQIADASGTYRTGPASNVQWNPATRELKIEGSTNPATLRLTGDSYRFCRLRIQEKGRLVIAERDPDDPPMVIYIDSQGCPNSSIQDRVIIGDDNGLIQNENDPSDLIIYGLGKKTKANGDPSTGLYRFVNRTNQGAPQGFVFIGKHWRYQGFGKGAVLGMVAAQDIRLERRSSVTWSSDVAYLNGAEAKLSFTYQVDLWRECGQPPNLTSFTNAPCTG